MYKLRIRKKKHLCTIAVNIYLKAYQFTDEYIFVILTIFFLKR